MSCKPSAHAKNASIESTIPLGSFLDALGNPANPGNWYGIDLRIQAAMNPRDAYPQMETDRLVESLGTQTSEQWEDRLKESLGVRVETLKPLEFLDGTRSFLENVGLTGFTEIEVDEQPFESQDSHKMHLREAYDLCHVSLLKDDSTLHTMEISASGKNEQFSLWLNFFYSRKHKRSEAPVELEVRAMSNELGPKQGESFPDYKARMKAIDSDVQKRARLYDAIDARKKALYSDFAHHLSQAFPGVSLKVYESVVPGES